VMAPMLLLTGLGAWVGKRARMPVRALSALVFNLFSPALVFDILATLDIPQQLVPRIVAVVVIGFVVSAAVTYLLSTMLHWSRPAAAGAALCVAMANMGNMGLPISALAFGSEGLAVAVVAMVTASVLANSGGIVIASLAGNGVGGALVSPLKVPALWAVVPGLLVNAGVVPLPVWLGSTSETLAGAAIPTMLVVLGLQIVERIPTPGDAVQLALPLSLRLLMGPAVAAAAALLVGLDGLARNTMIVLGGMPTAVATTIIAVQYHAQPELVSRTAVLSTGFSFVTLTLLIAFLG
jgi:malate permease and related proteins